MFSVSQNINTNVSVSVFTYRLYSLLGNYITFMSPLQFKLPHPMLLVWKTLFVGQRQICRSHSSGWRLVLRLGKLLLSLLLAPWTSTICPKQMSPMSKGCFAYVNQMCFQPWARKECKMPVCMSFCWCGLFLYRDWKYGWALWGSTLAECEMCVRYRIGQSKRLY